MGLFDSILHAVPLLGAAGEFFQKQKLQKQLQNKLNQKAPPLVVPDAYKQLMDGLNTQYSQLGTAAKAQNTTDFQNSLTQALSNLQQRGLASSNLTANLTAGNQKKLTEANNQLDENLLSSKLGADQSISLSGLNESAGERGQLAGIQGQMYGSLTAPILASSPFTDILKNLASFKPPGIPA